MYFFRQIFWYFQGKKGIFGLTLSELKLTIFFGFVWLNYCAQKSCNTTNFISHNYGT